MLLSLHLKVLFILLRVTSVLLGLAGLIWWDWWGGACCWLILCPFWEKLEVITIIPATCYQAQINFFYTVPLISVLFFPTNFYPCILVPFLVHTKYNIYNSTLYASIYVFPPVYIYIYIFIYTLFIYFLLLFSYLFVHI